MFDVSGVFFLISYRYGDRLGIIWGSFWEHVGIILGSRWDDLRIILEWYWKWLGVISWSFGFISNHFEPFRIHCIIIFGLFAWPCTVVNHLTSFQTISDHFGIVWVSFDSFWNYSGLSWDHFESSWNHLWMIPGSFGPPWNYVDPFHIIPNYFGSSWKCFEYI